MKIQKKLVLKTIYFSITVITLLAIGGCGSSRYVWYQPGKDVASFRQDHLQCEEESAKYARYMDKRGDKDIIFERMKECMGLRGYIRTPEQELPKGAARFDSAN